MSYFVRKKEEATEKVIEEDWGSLRWLANREIGNAEELTFGRVTIKKGSSNPSHTHPNCEEILYLLQGRLEHTIGDEKVVLEPGDTLTVEKGTSHHAVSIGESDAEMIVAYSSGERRTIGE